MRWPVLKLNSKPKSPPPSTKAKATVKATMKLRVWRHAEQKAAKFKTVMK